MSNVKRESIQEVIKKAEGAENVEIIVVPVEGEKISLLRVKEISRLAFVMWDIEKTTTASQMAFRMPYDGHVCYSVVCVCCRSETYGLQCPFGDEDEKNKWKKEMAVMFSKSIINTCKEYGIETIFMRKADEWNIHYGDSLEVKVVEAAAYRDACLDLYGRVIVNNAFQFISDYYSSGLKPSK